MYLALFTYLSRCLWSYLTISPTEKALDSLRLCKVYAALRLQQVLLGLRETLVVLVVPLLPLPHPSASCIFISLNIHIPTTYPSYICVYMFIKIHHIQPDITLQHLQSLYHDLRVAKLSARRWGSPGGPNAAPLPWRPRCRRSRRRCPLARCPRRRRTTRLMSEAQ